MCVFVLDIYRNAIKTDPGFIVFMDETEAKTVKNEDHNLKRAFFFVFSVDNF